MIYQWKSEARIKADAQAVGERLDAIRRKHAGLVTPEMVVDDARSKRSPLHDSFEWNDRKAAEAHRRDQAGYIIRMLMVQVDIIDREPATVRAFVSVTPDEEDPEPAYTSVQDALTSPNYRAQVISQARKEFLALRKKYAELQELADVFRAIDLTIAREGGEP